MALLAEARTWQRESGVDVWRPFETSRIEQDLWAGFVFIAKTPEGVCGTVTLTDSDPLVWDEDGSALYVHKLAASRSVRVPGVGARLLRWAEDVARQRGKRCLRLDTWDGNRKMREYYERYGFRHVRDRYFAEDSPLPHDYRGTPKSFYQLDLRESA